MGYTTYEFYTNEYYGDSVTESLFNKWNVKASDKLQYLCFGKINDDVLAKYSVEIQKATCALMDLLYSIEHASQNANNPEIGNVKSMSSGGQSISFGTNETLLDKAIGDEKAQYALMINTVAEYLCNTDLLYAGV